MSKTGTRLAAVAVVALLTSIWLGCGDTFRPVATPTFPPGGDPQGLRLAIAINDAGVAVGSTTHIDVSGDTVVASHTVGKGPVHAGTIPGASRIFVANAGDNTVSTYSTLVAGSAVTTISLPAGSAPIFAHSTQAARMYVANSGNATVGVIDATTNVLTDSIPVGNNPVALAELPGGNKVYCANQGSNSVSVISTADKLVLTTIPVGNMPSFAVANDTGAFVFVANSGSNTVSVIDTATDTVTTTLTVGAAPNFLFFDKSLKRVYVTNSGDGTVSIIRTDVSPPVILGTPITVGTTPLSVTALADGSRAYVADSGETTGCLGEAGQGRVSVINTNSNTVTKCITVGSNPVSIASSSDSTKVYVANESSNNISVIRTSDDTVVITITAPKVDPNCTVACPLQSPRFVLTAP